MLISTKGRYALRVMLDLADHNTGAFIPLKDIARRQNISEKYLEAIIAMLHKSGQVAGLRGKGGGYRLAKPPRDYTLGSLLRLTDGTLAPVACLAEEAAPCGQADWCRTRPLWQALDKRISGYLDHITLEDLQNGTIPE